MNPMMYWIQIRFNYNPATGTFDPIPEPVVILQVGGQYPMQQMNM
jgi:hypothetical protein